MTKPLCECGHEYQSHFTPHGNPAIPPISGACIEADSGVVGSCGCQSYLPVEPTDTKSPPKHEQVGERTGTTTNPNIDRPFNEMTKGVAVEVGALCKCGHGEEIHTKENNKCWRIWFEDGTTECDCAKFEPATISAPTTPDPPLPQPKNICACGHPFITHTVTHHPSEPGRAPTLAPCRALAPGAKAPCPCEGFTNGAIEPDPTVAKWRANPSARLGDFTGANPCRCGHAASTHSHVDTVHQIDGDARCLATSCPCTAYVFAMPLASSEIEESKPHKGIVIDPCQCGHHRNEHKRVERGDTQQGKLVEYVTCRITGCSCIQYLPDDGAPKPHPNDYTCQCGHTSDQHAGGDGLGKCTLCVCTQLTASDGNNPEHDPNFWFPGSVCAKKGCVAMRKDHDPEVPSGQNRATILCPAHWEYWSSGQGERDGWSSIGAWVESGHDALRWVESGHDALRVAPIGATPPVGSVPPDDKLMPPDVSMDEICARCSHRRFCHHKPSAPFPGACTAKHESTRIGSCHCEAFIGHDWAPKGEKSGVDSEGVPLWKPYERATVIEAFNLCAAACNGLSKIERGRVLAALRVIEPTNADPEFAALDVIVAALDGFDDRARYRVLEYIKDRYR